MRLNKTIKLIKDFIKNNPLEKGQFYNNIDGVQGSIFAIAEEKTNIIDKYILVDNKYIYYYDEEEKSLYIENKNNQKSKIIKL